MARAGLILDRDGTVVEERGYVTTADELVVLPGVVDALAEARRAGVAVALATNQAAIGRGIVTEATVTALHTWLGEQIVFDAIFVCPHHPDDGCACRKPLPGLVEQAIVELDLDRSRTMLVGDKLSDCEAGRAAGVSATLVRTGHGAQHDDAARAAGFDVVADLPTAVRVFLAQLDHHP
jgi:D-glycero-D-manno-heptose 1,7-bisphosphate phosphatase